MFAKNKNEAEVLLKSNIWHCHTKKVINRANCKVEEKSPPRLLRVKKVGPFLNCKLKG